MLYKEKIMSPKTKFDKKSIVDEALEIAKEKGLKEITARSVAKKLKSSVAPIYVNFDSVDELVESVVQRFFSLSEEYLEKQEGKSMFEKIGRASLTLAKEYPIIYRELAIEPNQYMSSYESIEENMLKEMSKDEDMKKLSRDEQKKLLFKMRAFQTGFLVMIVNNNIPSWIKENDIEKMLIEVGEELLFIKNRRI